LKQLLHFAHNKAGTLLRNLRRQELHRDEWLAVGFANFVDGTDVGMVESGSGARFAVEAIERLFVAGHAVGKKSLTSGPRTPRSHRKSR